MNYKPYVKKDDSVRIAPSAVLVGDITLDRNANIWHNATLRGDMGPILVGEGSNVQDNCVIHTDLGYTAAIGKGVTIGHGAIVHGCTIEDHVVVGMGAILLNGCHVSKNCIIGAGALIPEGKVIPEGSLVVGIPGKIVRTLGEEDIQNIYKNAEHYVEIAHIELD